jgi:hypothetical protein
MPDGMPAIHHAFQLLCQMQTIGDWGLINHSARRSAQCANTQIFDLFKILILNHQISDFICTVPGFSLSSGSGPSGRINSLAPHNSIRTNRGFRRFAAISR